MFLYSASIDTQHLADRAVPRNRCDNGDESDQTKIGPAALEEKEPEQDHADDHASHLIRLRTDVVLHRRSPFLNPRR